MKIRLVGMIVLALVSAVDAQQEGVGLGVIVGEPTGFSLKKWLNDRDAIDAAAAWSFSENDSFQLHADYLRHKHELLKAPTLPGELLVYFGAGARIIFKESNGRGEDDDDTFVGIRIPLGITYLFVETPVDIFAEIVPILDIAPETDLDINAAIGIRYYL
jgi:hypothetical protein